MCTKPQDNDSGQDQVPCRHYWVGIGRQGRSNSCNHLLQNLFLPCETLSPILLTVGLATSLGSPVSSWLRVVSECEFANKQYRACTADHDCHLNHQLMTWQYCVCVCVLVCVSVRERGYTSIIPLCKATTIRFLVSHFRSWPKACGRAVHYSLFIITSAMKYHANSN